jgi:uncharacterized protein
MPSSSQATRLPTEPVFRTTRLGVATSLGGIASIMERNTLEEVKAHLMATKEDFRRLADEHSELKKKLGALESLPHLTYEQELEETRLKKIKLRLKDQMETMVNQYRSQEVA